MIHETGCPKEADERNETCDCARLRELDRVEWHRACYDKKALVINFHPQGGVTVMHRGRDGRLYGCRDILRKPGRDAEFASCVAAWVSGARAEKLDIEDMAGACDDVRAIANKLIGDVS